MEWKGAASVLSLMQLMSHVSDVHDPSVFPLCAWQDLFDPSQITQTPDGRFVTINTCFKSTNGPCPEEMGGWQNSMSFVQGLRSQSVFCSCSYRPRSGAGVCEPTPRMLTDSLWKPFVTHRLHMQAEGQGEVRPAVQRPYPGVLLHHPRALCLAACAAGGCSGGRAEFQPLTTRQWFLLRCSLVWLRSHMSWLLLAV